MLEPVEQFVLLTETDVGYLTGMRMCVDETRAEEAARGKTRELVLALSPAVLVEDVLDELLLSLRSLIDGAGCVGGRMT